MSASVAAEALTALDVVLGGLRRLEYRGYDSAGVALHTPEGLVMVKRSGKLARLTEGDLVPIVVDHFDLDAVGDGALREPVPGPEVRPSARGSTVAAELATRTFIARSGPARGRLYS